eukprot:snap_masked-scaffold_11-processed-gene-0.17-mRNA-1 protein AED:1.00 eAED:1.00 QI:0/-1/0/0/-1/1/1/0/79
MLADCLELKQQTSIPTSEIKTGEMQNCCRLIFKSKASSNILTNPLRVEKVFEAIRTLKSNKAPGSDMIRNEVLKNFYKI